MSELHIKEAGTHHTEFRNQEDTLRVDIKWDGCVNMWLHSNGSTVTNPIEGEVDYIHVCELKEFIEQLQCVLKHAEERKFEL